MPNSYSAKLVLAAAQASWLMTVGGYLIFRTQWVVLPGFLSIACLMVMRCNACSTPFTDHRIYDRFNLVRFWKTRIVDECPVCSRKMFPQ